MPFASVVPRSLSRPTRPFFFNVRDRLDRIDFILNSVFAASVARGLRDRDFDLLWKLIGYLYGPKMLDAVISPFGNNSQWVNRRDEVPAGFQDMAIGLIRKKAALAAITVEVNDRTQLDLIDAFTKLIDIERNSDSPGQASDQILQGIDAMMASLPFAVATEREGLAQQPPGVAEFDNTAVELRSDELISVAAGFSLRNPELLKQLSFPQRDS